MKLANSHLLNYSRAETGNPYQQHQVLIQAHAPGSSHINHNQGNKNSSLVSQHGAAIMKSSMRGSTKILGQNSSIQNGVPPSNITIQQSMMNSGVGGSIDQNSPQSGIYHISKQNKQSMIAGGGGDIEKVSPQISHKRIFAENNIISQSPTKPANTNNSNNQIKLTGSGTFTLNQNNKDFGSNNNLQPSNDPLLISPQKGTTNNLGNSGGSPLLQGGKNITLQKC